MSKKFLNSEQTRNKYLNLINNLKRDTRSNVNFNLNFVENPFLEIIGESNETFDVRFYDNEELIHQTNLKCNMWTKLNRQYYTKWRTEVRLNDKIIFNNNLNLENKRVYIAIDSTSLGDNIAWMPYLEVFRKKHNCILIASTFKNKLFQNEYPNITFIEPGTVVNNIYAMYKIGWFYDTNKEPEIPNIIPLQKTATNILGLDFIEYKPRVTKPISNDKVEEKYITIAPHSTAGLKHWNNPNGWQETIDFLISNGFKVVNISKEGCDLKGVENPSDYSLEKTINLINGCEFFIGLSSGLSWLSWALDKRVIMISNFTEDNHEFITNCSRVTNKSVCNSCWNNTNYKFDKGDWNWCPKYKNTKKQFECHTSITSDMVIDEIKKII